MTAYSVSCTGVDAGHHRAEAEHEEDDPGQREARRTARMPVAAPLPTEVLRHVVRPGEERVDRSTADGEEDPDEREQQADLPEGHLRAERDGAEELGLDPLVEKERPA